MTERGMIFNAEMVRAVLDGSKTQTRRIMKVQPHAGIRNSVFVKSGFEDGHGKELVCPFGAVGDRLWVRETWQAIHDSLDEFGNVDERTWMPSIPKSSDSYWHAVYAEEFGVSNREDRGFPWRPAIHMPRWASRITLEITGVRVERLQGVSEADARAEGINPAAGGVEKGWEHRINFRELWMGIYGADSWQANPWVWVIEFKRVEVE